MSTRAPSGQRPLYQIWRHHCAWHSVGRAAASPFADASNRPALLEPFAHVEIKSDAEDRGLCDAILALKSG